MGSMSFYADFHIHSKFSRATSRDATLEQYALWAGRKGLALVGTGDFTHPGWWSEIQEKLVAAEAGLFRLRPDLEREVAGRLPPACAGEPVRFMLEVEISTIYKKDDRTRKVHHLVCAPDLTAAESFTRKLSRIGNVASDGRPILGLDSRDLLEIALESGEGTFLIPAHIWTPWFSVLGSKSGFDSVAACFGDLAEHIFAVETGLSSDPPMNWRVSSLDRYRLVSNSDAHSPAKLAREACVFHTELSFPAVRDALRTGLGYGGTVEFFPEEGKYHLDGHRKCGVRLTPPETRKHRGRCPACGKPGTVGVMIRVEELADRPEGVAAPCAAPFRSFVPLPEVLAEIVGTGPDSNRVRDAYEAVISRIGPELFVLASASAEDLRRKGSPPLAEAIGRMREGRVTREAGYDGEYGVIRLFRPDELAATPSEDRLFDLPATPRARAEPPGPAPLPSGDGAVSFVDAEAGVARVREEPAPYGGPDLFGILGSLDPDQRAAAEVGAGPLLIVAGPGTGKTRTLTHRIAHLVKEHGLRTEQCLAITFTNRAAREMIERLEQLLPDEAPRVAVMTFHRLGHAILREHGSRLGLGPAFRVADEAEALRVLMEATAQGAREAGRLRKAISIAKRAGQQSAAGQAAYEQAMRARGLVDFDDLIVLPLKLLDENAEVAAAYHERYPWVSVDEYQDIDECQYRLVRHLVPANGNILAIGDPDQAIYSFRGTDVRFFQRFAEDFPGARTVQLTRNYRSGRMIVGAAMQVISPSSLVPGRVLKALATDSTRLTLHESATERAEAVFVARTIEELLGGSSFYAMDSGQVESGAEESYTFSDFAVLYRTDAQAEALCDALAHAGLPYQRLSHGRLSDSPAAKALVEAMVSLAEEPVVARRLERAEAALKRGDPRGETVLLTQALRPLAERCPDMGAFLSELAMATDVDLWDPRADCISLLTLHASKGLEFAVVLVAGCEDGILPLRFGAEENQDGVAEERRLFFVGMTRAKRRLYLSYARKRLWQGAVREMSPTPFLSDIAEQLFDRRRTQTKRPQPKIEQLSLL